MRSSHVRGLFVWGLTLAALASAWGCGMIEIVPSTPPPEAVLEGTWKLTTENDVGLTQTFFTFDARGQLDKVTYKVGQNTTVTDNSPTGHTTVLGNSVTIDSSFAGSGQVLKGTLDETKTVITGQTGTEIQFGNISISVDNGAITLTKQ